MKTVCKCAVLLQNLILVFDEVMVPHFDCVGIVDSLIADCLNFKTTTFNLVDVPSKWARSISTREDVLTHEVAPDEVFVLPVTAQASDLQEKETIISQQRADLSHVRLVITNSHMLAHLKAADLVELTILVDSDLTVVFE